MGFDELRLDDWLQRLILFCFFGYLFHVSVIVKGHITYARKFHGPDLRALSVTFSFNLDEATISSEHQPILVSEFSVLAKYPHLFPDSPIISLKGRSIGSLNH